MSFQILDDVEYEVVVPDYVNVTKSVKCSVAEKISSSRRGWCYTKPGNVSNGSGKGVAAKGVLVWSGDYDSFDAETNTFYYSVEERVGSHREIRVREGYVDFNPVGKRVAPGESHLIKIVGKKRPKLGPNNIDWRIRFMDYEPDWAWWNGSWNYRYVLNVSLSGASYSTHINQFITLNITGLNGTNSPALVVVSNESGSDTEIGWEWHHERNHSAYSVSYVNDTIRFRVNSTNGSVNRYYSIYTTNDGSIPARNQSLVEYYDGFELGTVAGYAQEYLTPTPTIESTYVYNGDYSVEPDSGTAQWMLPETVEGSDIYFGFGMRLGPGTVANKDIIRVYFENKSGSSNAFDLVANDKTYNPAMLYWNDGGNQFVVSTATNVWNTWVLKNCDFSGADALCGSLYINQVLNDTDIVTMGTVDALGCVGIYGNYYVADGDAFDEIFITDGVDFNLYPTLPVISVGSEEVNGSTPPPPPAGNVSGGVIRTSSGNLTLSPAGGLLLNVSGLSMLSPNGSWFCCGPSDGGAWSCESGRCG